MLVKGAPEMCMTSSVTVMIDDIVCEVRDISMLEPIIRFVEYQTVAKGNPNETNRVERVTWRPLL